MTKLRYLFPVPIREGKRALDCLYARLQNCQIEPATEIIEEKPVIFNREMDEMIDNITIFKCPDCNGGYVLKKQDNIEWIDKCKSCLSNGYLDWIENMRGIKNG